MTLQDFLNLAGISDREMAEVIGIDRTAIYRYRTGKKLPCWESMLRIAAATRNMVTPNDFFEPQHIIPPGAGRWNVRSNLYKVNPENEVLRATTFKVKGRAKKESRRPGT